MQPVAMFRATVLICLALASFAVSSALAEDPAKASAPKIEITPALVDRLVAEAQAHNPVIAAAEARLEAATAGVAAVRTWEDPMLTVGVSMPTARGFKASEEGNLIYGVEQKLPTFDRPKLARAVAEADAAKEKLNVGYETAKLRRDLLLALTDLGLDDATIDLVQQDLEWLEATLTAVDSRYRVGKASQVEWLKIQTEKAKTLDRLKTLKLEREHQQVQVNRLLNRDLHAEWAVTELPALQPAVSYSDELVNAAIQAEPKLRVMRQETAQAEAVARATRQTRKPELGIGLQGRSYSGDAGFREGMVTVNFTLPWLNDRRYQSDFLRDRAKVRAGEQDTADYILSIREELHHLITELDAARRQTLLYRDELIPLTEQTLASASAAWENSLGMLQDMLDARRLLVDHRLMVAQSLAEQSRTLAELSLLTGTTDFAAFTGPAIPREKPMVMPVPGESK